MRRWNPFGSAGTFWPPHSRVSVLVVDVIIPETGADMGTFETLGRLASWAGLSPGSNESAGRTKSPKSRPGDLYLKGALGTAALSIARHPRGTYLGAHSKRLVVRRGKMKALVATEHSILTAVWHLLVEGECFHELGFDVNLGVREAA